MWNELDLKPPPTFTCKLTAAAVSFKQLRQLSDVLWDALSVLRNQEALFTEAATLSRLIYRMKSMFRGDKGFKAIEKINHCLRHYLSLNLTPIYDNFFRTIPWDSSEKFLYCPTRQMLEYILVRTQGLAALLCRIVHTSMEAAFLFKTRMSTGHNWQVSLLCLGVASRIWALSKHILASCVKWYSAMLPFLDIFQVNGPLWLPEEYSFPHDLTKWLDVPWICKLGSSCERNEQLDTEVTTKVLHDKTKDYSSFSYHITPRVQSIQDDLGVSISRDSIQMPEPPSVGVHSPLVEEPGVTNTNEEAERCVEFSDSPKQVKLNRKKLKRKRMVNKTNVEKVGVFMEVGTSPETSVGFDSGRMKEQVQDQDTLDVPLKKKRIPKVKNITKVLSSIHSHSDVQTLLDRESKKRSLTCSLDSEQWKLLKKLVGKLNLKLTRAEAEEKRHHLLLQIKKAFQIALS